MEDKVDLSAADKARLVWKAAHIQKPLDDVTAAALGDDLSWAATWYETDCAVTSQERKKGTSQKRKTDELKDLGEISRNAGALAKLLRNDNAAVRRLERFYPDPFQPKGPPNLSEMQCGFEALEVAANKALAERRKVKLIPSPRGISSLDRYIFELAEIFKKYVDAAPGTSTTDGKKGGPFVRFVRAAAHQFGIKPPAGETIAAALRKRKATPEHSKHVIGRVKFHSR
jgi:hypothetical protein